MRLAYAAIVLILAAEAGVVLWAATPDVDPVYRSVYIDRSSACYPLPVDGEYTLGHVVEFAQGRDGSARGHILRCGLRDPARDGSWSDGVLSMFRFKMEPTQSDLALDVVMWPYLVIERLPSQRITVTANGESVATLDLRGDPVPFHRIVIPRSSAQPMDGYLDITFNYHDARSPAELGLNRDDYRYAVLLQSLRLTRMHQPAR